MTLKDKLVTKRESLMIHSLEKIRKTDRKDDDDSLMMKIFEIYKSTNFLSNDRKQGVRKHHNEYYYG